jgi:hypothetical protein
MNGSASACSSEEELSACLRNETEGLRFGSRSDSSRYTAISISSGLRAYNLPNYYISGSCGGCGAGAGNSGSRLLKNLEILA